MGGQDHSHQSPHAQAQQSQQDYAQAQYTSFGWVPPQWIQHIFEAANQANAVNAAEGLQPPQLPTQALTSNALPPPCSQQSLGTYSTQLPENLLAPSWSPTEYAIFPCRRLPRPDPEPKIDWLEFVNNLPWLINNEMPKEDRTCPFCWGEFGLDLVYEEEEEDVSDSSSEKEEEEEEEEEGGGEGEDEHYLAEQLVAPTLNGLAGGMAGLHVTNPDLLQCMCGMTCVCETEEEFEDEEEDMEEPLWAELTEAQKSDMHHLRRETGVEEEKEKKKEKVGKKHYAVKLPCGHLYGHMCLVKMLESGEMICPKCRKDIVEVQSSRQARRNAFSFN